MMLFSEIQINVSYKISYNNIVFIKNKATIFNVKQKKKHEPKIPISCHFFSHFNHLLD
jgi:hypothetical protein